MEAIRQIVKPHNHKITITLPNIFEDKEVEVIILPSDETINTAAKKDLKSTELNSTDLKSTEFDPEEYVGSLNTGLTIDKIDEECKKMREEWNRGF